MSIDITQFHKTFLDEAREALDQIESGVLAMEEGGNDEALNAIFRAAHSIKGGAGTFGFAAVADLTHHLETILDRRRQKTTSLGPDLINILLESVDCLRTMFDALESGEVVDAVRVAELTARLDEMANNELDSAPGSGPETQRKAAMSPTDRAAEPVRQSDGADALGSVGRRWRIEVNPDPQIFMTGNDPGRFVEDLAELGSVVVVAELSSLPPLVELDVETCYLRWTIELDVVGSQSASTVRAQIRDVFEWAQDEIDLQVVEIDRPASPRDEARNDRHVDTGASTSGGVPQPDKAVTKSPGLSIRVDIDKVDQLINLVGELVITQSMLQQVASSTSAVDRERLREGLAELESHTRDLQGSVLQVRMLPIDAAFSRIPRLVRDLAAKLNKQVDLVFEGESTELDKTVLEKIGDPLVHLVRNSLDHGIGTPEVRRSSGKPPAGLLKLSAHHDGGSIVVSVTDDGMGLDHDRILAKARQSGLVNDDDQPTLEQIERFIFLPGFTTAASVSEVSGRGVGMDVVRRNVTDLGGSVEVESRAGEGTTFSIRLPMTLAIADGQLVRVGSTVFVVPLLSIVESLQFDASLASSLAPGAEVYRHRDAAIPLIDIRDVLELGRPEQDSPEQDSTAQDSTAPLIVIVEVGGTRAGLLVDELLGQQQIVIKSLTTNFRPVPGLSGATILGDGTVAMIIDANSLLGMYRSVELERVQ